MKKAFDFDDALREANYLQCQFNVIDESISELDDMAHRLDTILEYLKKESKKRKQMEKLQQEEISC